MMGLLKRLYRKTVSLNHEADTIIDCVMHACEGSVQQCKVLEVGCGRGRYLHLLSGLGFDITGVDVNLDLVLANQKAGLRCFTVEDFAHMCECYDAILMSHVIEHFSPNDLVPFIDNYLDRLKVGGSLIIATPLMTRFFYDDFDHVKPYHPMGLLMVFGEERAQVQYYSRNKLRLEDVWIRRGYWRFSHVRARYVKSSLSRILQIVELGSALAFRFTGGIIGHTDGWVGVFRKFEPHSFAGTSSSRPLAEKEEP